MAKALFTLRSPEQALANTLAFDASAIRKAKLSACGHISAALLVLAPETESCPQHLRLSNPRISNVCASPAWTPVYNPKLSQQTKRPAKHTLQLMKTACDIIQRMVNGALPIDQGLCPPWHQRVARTHATAAHARAMLEHTKKAQASSGLSNFPSMF